MVNYGQPRSTALFYHSLPWLSLTQKHGSTMVLLVGFHCRLVGWLVLRDSGVDEIVMGQ